MEIIHPGVSELALQAWPVPSLKGIPVERIVFALWRFIFSRRVCIKRAYLRWLVGNSAAAFGVSRLVMQHRQ